MNNNDENLQEQLHGAINDNDLELIETLLKSVDVNLTDQQHEPLLYRTIINKQWNIAQLLIQHNALLTHPSWSTSSKTVTSNILHYAIKDLNTSESFIDFLLTRPKITIKQADSNTYLPILTAARHGNLRILKHLVNNYNPDIHATAFIGHYNLFHCAMLSKSDCLIELLDYIHSLGVDINATDHGKNDFHQKATPLTYAIYGGANFEIIQHLVELGANVITKDDVVFTQKNDKPFTSNSQSHLFRAAILKDDFQIFNYLVGSCNTNIPFKALVREAFIAIDFQFIKLVIEKYRDRFDVDPYQIDLFHHCFQPSRTIDVFMQSEVFHTKVTIIEYLLEQKVLGCFDFGMKSYSFHIKDTSPLLIICQYPQSTLHLLELMVENGANIHDTDKDGSGVLQLLCDIDSDTTVDVLISKIDYFISLGVDVNKHFDSVRNIKIASALHHAIDNEAFATILVPHLINKHNADISLTDEEGCTPLHIVNHVALVDLLLSPTETINQRNDDGCTPLLMSLWAPRVHLDYYGMISKLLQCGANVNLPDNTPTYPIHVIFQDSTFDAQPIEVIKLLITYNNIDLNVVRGEDERTPLHQTILLFMDPPDPDDEDSDEHSLRLKAIESMRLLIEHGANVTQTFPNCYNGFTILHFFISHGSDLAKTDDDSIDDDSIEEAMTVILDGIIHQTILNQVTNSQ